MAKKRKADDRAQADDRPQSDDRPTGIPGRRAFMPTDENRRAVRHLAQLGINHQDICYLVINPDTHEPIDPKTLRDRFRFELDTAVAETNALAAATILRFVKGAPAEYNDQGQMVREEQKPVLGAAVWWEKSRGGKSEYSPMRDTSADKGKKATAEEAARTAEKGTSWDQVINPPPLSRTN